ncbi:Ppx/GppA family phosphatase [Rickettsiales bacterium]|nr:Ppx/GppA family phosphatase [Rickettsiales bacterium]
MENHPIAIIDIGSNSVRLVIYDALKRAPMPIFNEKLLCGLAKNMDSTGVLNEEAVPLAIQTIRRFIQLALIMNSSEIHLIATSAVRDAKDGRDFVKEIEKEHKIEVQIIEGEKEAELAGYGILSSIPGSKGVVADLGGGSLELASIKNHAIKEKASYPIGPLRICTAKSSLEEQKSIIEQHLQKFPLDKTLNGKDLYLVGGAFRNIAKVHMEKVGYPLKVINNYTVTKDDFIKTLDEIGRMTTSRLKNIPRISSKRVEFLPFTILILRKIIEMGNPENITFSAYGIREGYLYDQLSSSQKKEDPLISGCIDITRIMLKDPDYGYELFQWMSPLFANESPKGRRLRLAACLLHDISSYENTEYRAEMAYRRIMDSSLMGISHKGRLFLANALYFRYSNVMDKKIVSKIQNLLSPQRFLKAKIIGSAIRLGRSISCSHFGVLKETNLQIDEDQITLNLGSYSTSLYGEPLEKRIRNLADLSEREYEIL